MTGRPRSVGYHAGIMDARHPFPLTRRRILIGAGMAALSCAGVPVRAAEDVAEAPEDAPFRNYSRPRPTIATAGLLGEGGAEQARALGFKLVIDLRTRIEPGVGAQAEAAKALGLPLVNLPIWKTPNETQVDAFAALLADESNLPILVHCHAADRVGALWALYRVRHEGADPQVAFDEGLAIGLRWYKGGVRRQLGL
ncbi:MAG: sulfur transferase domain-containing protein [Pseudomonadota bacterium]